MDYIILIVIIFSILTGILALLTFQFFFFAVVGIFFKETYPKANEQLRYGIMIAARNEERVIGQLIDSIRANDYPQDKIDIFISAHNCTDKTAEIARAKGAIVVEYNNPEGRTMGWAYKGLFEGIMKMGINPLDYDGFMSINADNLLSKNYFEKMNDAFIAKGKNRVIISYRNASNFGSNYMSILYGLFFIAACRFESRGRTYCDCSTRVSGTGYLFSSEIVKDGWPYVTLTEDWEFTADQISQGNKIYYCDDAVFYDEQPTSFKVMWTQRLRWARGHTIVFLTRFKECFRALFRKETKNKGSVYDIMVAISPLGVYSLIVLLIELIMIALAPLFGCDAGAVWLGFGKYCLIMGCVSYVVTLISVIILTILEKRRIPKLNFFKYLLAILVWPFFLGMAVIQDIMSFFIKKFEWKTIPHTGENVQIKEESK